MASEIEHPMEWDDYDAAHDYLDHSRKRRTALASPAPADGLAGQVKVPEGQTPLDDQLGHRYLDVIKEGDKARISGTASPYHGHSLEHCLHATGWVARDLRMTLDALQQPREAADVVEADEAFCAAVWEALKGDHNDLRRQAIILKAHRALRSPTWRTDMENAPRDGTAEAVKIVEQMIETYSSAGANLLDWLSKDDVAEQPRPRPSHRDWQAWANDVACRATFRTLREVRDRLTALPLPPKGQNDG